MKTASSWSDWVAEQLELSPTPAEADLDRVWQLLSESSDVPAGKQRGSALSTLARRTSDPRTAS